MASAVPSLYLTERDQCVLRQLSAQLQREAVTLYEDFLFRGQRRVDATAWKLERSNGDLRAFSERKPRRSISSKLLPSHYADMSNALAQNKVADQPHAALAAQSPLARVLVTGTFRGTLDDVMYGASFHDTPSLHAYWLAQSTRMEESAVLATIDEPCNDDPYRFLGVAWFLRAVPVPFQLVHRRDLLALQARQLANLRNGERVGVSLSHSIQHRDFAEMRELHITHATTSALKIFRQIDAQRVEVFIVQYLDIKGNAPDALRLNELMRLTLPIGPRACVAGFRRKLHWQLRRREREREACAESDVIEPSGSGSNDSCEVCAKSVGALFARAGSSCRLCYKRICSRCTIPQPLPEVAPLQRAKMVDFDFCIACVLVAKSMATLAVAQDEMLCHGDSGHAT